jgi:uncharacterized protein YpmB
MFSRYRFQIIIIIIIIIIIVIKALFLSTRYFCRSVEYDEQTHLCVLSEEDSVSQKDDLRTSSSPTHHLYDLVCLDNRECFCNIQLINIL